MRVALVHDYLFEYGGAERVLETLHELWPQAPIYTSFVDWGWVRQNKKEWLKWQIVASWFDKIPGKKELCSPFRFLAPWIWENFNLKDFDLVVSSSAWFMCKGVITHPGTVHVCYCHTPPRYLYGYPESIAKKNWLVRFYAALVNPGMRYWDYLTSNRVDYFICNSRNVQMRIKKFYRREAEVIYPPIQTQTSSASWRIKMQTQNLKHKTDYYLMVNRLVWPKRVDLAIEACKQLGLNLKIIGQGKAEAALKELVGGDSHIEFLGYVGEKRLSELYRDCKAVLYLAEEEDFGMTPLEAMSFGKPVIALRSGGVTESVIEAKTGFFLDKPDKQELINLLKKFDHLDYKNIKPEECLKQAAKFSKERFKAEIKNFIKKVINA